MISEDNNPHRLARESIRTRRKLTAVPVALVVATLANAVAGHGLLDGWLSFAVVASALGLVIVFAINGIKLGLLRSFGTWGSPIDDLPTWFVTLSVGLAAAWIAVAVIILVTP